MLARSTSSPLVNDLCPACSDCAQTRNVAVAYGKDRDLGTLEPGKIADLLILNANPLEDITVLDRPEAHLLTVFKEGRVVVSRWSQLEVSSRRPVKIA